MGGEVRLPPLSRGDVAALLGSLENTAPAKVSNIPLGWGGNGVGALGGNLRSPYFF